MNIVLDFFTLLRVLRYANNYFPPQFYQFLEKQSNKDESLLVVV